MSGLRFNGSTSSAQTSGGSSSTSLSSSGQLTFLAWIYPYDSQQGVLVSRGNNSAENYSVFVNSLGAVGLKIGAFQTTSDNGAVTPLEWNHVAVTVNALTNQAQFYVNGILVGTRTISATYNAISSYNVTVGLSQSSGMQSFFGKMTEVSLHNIVRNSSYILAASTIPPVENNPDSSAQSQNTNGDNGDRLVVINYDVPQDFNYSTIYIIRGDFNTPEWEDDGVQVGIINASAGQQVFTDAEDFICGHTYYYRVMTQNSLGNYSYQSDSPLLKVVVPSFTNVSILSPLSPPLYPVTDATAQPGDSKIYVSWTNYVLDERIAIVQVYSDPNSYPSVSVNQGATTITGTLVFEGSVEDTGFVDRNLTNGTASFYSIINKDRYGRTSVVANVTAVPATGLDETGIPLLEVKDLTYQVVDNQKLSIQFNSPVSFSLNLNAYFNERILLYGSVTDEFGAPISAQTNITMIIKPDLTYANLANDPFGVLNQNAGLQDSDFYTFGVSRPSPGIVQGALAMTSDLSKLSLLSTASFDVQLYSYVDDAENPGDKLFEFYSQTVTMNLSNPWLMTLSNRDGKTIKHKCPPEAPEDGSPPPQGHSYKNYDGAYCRATSPFVVRCILSYEGAPLALDSTIRVQVWDAEADLCSKNVVFTPTKPSTTILAPATTLPVQTGMLPSTNASDPPGTLVLTSYVDIPLTVPRLPQEAILYVLGEYAGYVSVQSFNFVIENILNVDLTERTPSPDGVDVAEQFATVYIIDPDFPDDKTKYTTVPDFTVAQWQLQLYAFGQPRPFYSTDNIQSLSGQVLSYVRSGVASDVFWGPISGVQWHAEMTPDGDYKEVGESYEVVVTVLWDGLEADDNAPAVLSPVDSSSSFGARFLMEFPAFKNLLWADGEDYVRLVISRSSNTYSIYSRYGGCFQSCALAEGGELIDMTPGQIITLNVDKTFDIIWGDVVESTDPYTGENDLIVGKDANIAHGTAYVQLADAPETFVYFRINAFFPPPAMPCKGQPVTNDCGCLGIKSDDPLLTNQCQQFIVAGTTLILVNRLPVSFQGGGDMGGGVPPTILYPEEPLQISIVGLLVNGQASNTIVLDGVTSNQVVVEVSFSSYNVPNGTPITVDIQSALDGGIPRITLNSPVIYTRNEILSQFDPINKKSYAIVTINPVAAENGLFEQLIFTTTYDKSGTVARKQIACLTLEWQPSSNSSDPTQNSNNNIISKLYAYNIVSNTWDDTLSPMTNPRGSVCLEGYNGYLYAIGGVTLSTISQSNERYSLLDDSWTEMTIIPTGRFAASSVQFNGKIYVIGGIAGDATTGNLLVSNAVEVYDIASNTWTVLSNMPNIEDGTVDGVPYPICFGVAKYMSVGGENRIYILAGVTSIDPTSGNPTGVNDRILYYSIDLDTWAYTEALTGFELEIYQRISPSAFVDGEEIVVFGGVSTGSSTDTTLTFFVDSFKFNPTTGILVENDGDFSTIPVPRYKAATTSLGSINYVLGGSDEASETLNIFEGVNSASNPFGYSSLAPLPDGGTMLAMTSATIPQSPYSGSEYIFVVGGFSSGRPPGFLQIQTAFAPDPVRLDGQQSCAVAVSMADANGNPPTRNVKIIIRGYVKFPGSGGDSSVGQSVDQQQSTAAQKSAAAVVDSTLAVYPVLFTSNTIETNLGNAVVTLLPRSDDVLEGLQELASKAKETQQQLAAQGIGGAGDAASQAATHVVIYSGQSRQPYDILVQITIIDDFYFGQTIEDLSGAGLGNPTDQTGSGSNSGGSGSGASPTGSGVCAGGQTINGSLSLTPYNPGLPVVLPGGGFTGSGSNGQFSLLPSTLGQLNSPIVPYYIDIDWIPAINVLISDEENAANTLVVLKNLQNEIPFGGSAMFDAMVAASEFLSINSLQGIGKVMYVFTDNEANMSINTIDQAIAAVNSIDGYQEVPVVAGNFNIVNPITLSAKANTTDTDTLNQITEQTGGQSVTVLSEAYENESVAIFVGEAQGSLGYGEATINIDMGEPVKIDSLSSLFQLYTNTNGTWDISYSDTGYVFTSVPEVYTANQLVPYPDMQARYLRFHATLLTGFTASNEPVYEDIPLPASPALVELEINYELGKDNYLYLNTDKTIAAVEQVTMAVDSSLVNPQDIQVGVAESSSFNWDDYSSNAKPSVPQDGKVFVPIRFTNDSNVYPYEPMDKLDKYTFVPHFGSWNPASVVEILDPDGNIVDPSSYKAYPRDGVVVFNQRTTGVYSIQIVNGDDFRVGVKMHSYSTGTPLQIYGVGFLYNTNVTLLPPLEKLPPVVRDVRLLPDSPGRYDTITASYEYFDSNNNPEDTSKRVVNWYINGVIVPFLSGLLQWNNINSPTDPLYTNCFTFNPATLSVNNTVIAEARRENESIVNAGDQVYFTISVNDGTVSSPTIQSNVITISEAPPSVDSVDIVGLEADGTLTNNLTADTAAVVQFSLLSDSDINNSQITWFVNGQKFKTGTYGVTANIDRIQAGERNTNGQFGMYLNNSIYVTVTPQTGGSSGTPVSSSEVIVGNALPVASNVVVAPSNPVQGQNIVLTFTFFDYDIAIGNTSQTNMTTVAWSKSNISTGGDFVVVPSLNNLSVVPSTNLTRGDQWKATVTPNDGLDNGIPVDSNIVTIG